MIPGTRKSSQKAPDPEENILPRSSSLSSAPDTKNQSLSNIPSQNILDYANKLEESNKDSPQMQGRNPHHLMIPIPTGAPLLGQNSTAIKNPVSPSSEVGPKIPNRSQTGPLNHAATTRQPSLNTAAARKKRFMKDSVYERILHSNSVYKGDSKTKDKPKDKPRAVGMEVLGHKSLELGVTGRRKYPGQLGYEGPGSRGMYGSQFLKK